MANFFSGMNGLDTFEKGSFLTDGQYRASIELHKATTDRDDNDMLIVELRIQEVLQAFDPGADVPTRDGTPFSGSLMVGTKAAYILKFPRNRSGDLTDIGKMNMGKARAFFAAALGGISLSDVDGDAVNLVCAEDPDNGIEAGRALAGTQLHVAATSKTSRNGKIYTQVNFTFVEAWN